MWRYEVVPSLLGGLSNEKFGVPTRRWHDRSFALDETLLHGDLVFDTEKAAIRHGRTWLAEQSESQARSYADGTPCPRKLVSRRAVACPQRAASPSINRQQYRLTLTRLAKFCSAQSWGLSLQ